jgi:hypothetical protein
VHGGRKAGILTGLGIAVGDFIHTLERVRHFEELALRERA